MYEIQSASLLWAFLFTIPAGWIIAWFGFRFWGFDPSRIRLKLALFSAAQSAVTASVSTLADTNWTLIVSLIGYSALFFLFFRSVPLPIRLSVASLTALMHVLLDGYTYTIAYEQPAALLYVVPALLALLAFCWLMRRSGVCPGVRVLRVLETMRRRNMVYLIVFLLLQCLIVMLFVSTVYDFREFENRTVAMILVLISCVLGVAILFLAVRAIALNKEAAVKMTQDHYMEDINRMFATIRGQRQDFMNHAQTILDYVERDEMDALKRYTDELVGEISEVNELLRIGHPAFAALIQAKMVIALNRKIDFQYEFSDMESLDLGVKSIDLVKIVGNLIDNAFDEAAKLEEDDRWVEVGGWLHQNTLYITVRNPGRVLDERERELIFSTGYTTKKDGHSGLGLSIVKERIEYYKGSILVESSEEDGILFKLAIPVSQKKTAI